VNLVSKTNDADLNHDNSFNKTPFEHDRLGHDPDRTSQGPHDHDNKVKKPRDLDKKTQGLNDLDIRSNQSRRLNHSPSLPSLLVSRLM